MIRVQVVQPINEILFSVDYMSSTFFYAIAVKLYFVFSADSVRDNAVVFNNVMVWSEAGERQRLLSLTEHAEATEK
jgi:hypothetical protein